MHVDRGFRCEGRANRDARTGSYVRGRLIPPLQELVLSTESGRRRLDLGSPRNRWVSGVSQKPKNGGLMRRATPNHARL